MPAYRSPQRHNDETLFDQEELADVPTWARFQSRVRGVLHCWDARELAQHFYHRKTNGLAPTALNPITNLPFPHSPGSLPSSTRSCLQGDCRCTSRKAGSEADRLHVPPHAPHDVSPSLRLSLSQFETRHPLWPKDQHVRAFSSSALSRRARRRALPRALMCMRFSCSAILPNAPNPFL